MENYNTRNFIIEKPEKYKDIYVKFLQAIIEANTSRDLDTRIESYINCINVGLGAIPKGAYDIDRLKRAKPDFILFKKNYFKQQNLLIMEHAIYHTNKIRHEWKEEWLNNLQWEFQEINQLVKKYTNWFFDAPKTSNTIV